MNTLIIAIEAGLIVGIIGVVIGIILAISSKIFFVKEDNRIEIIYEMLPHFNWGACGTAGCKAFAASLVSGENTIDKCKPSKPDVKDAINFKLESLKSNIKKDNIIKEDLTMSNYVCRCKQVTEDAIIEKVKEGLSLEEIKQATGAGTACGGCNKKLATIVENNK